MTPRRQCLWRALECAADIAAGADCCSSARSADAGAPRTQAQSAADIAAGAAAAAVRAPRTQALSPRDAAVPLAVPECNRGCDRSRGIWTRSGHGARGAGPGASANGRARAGASGTLARLWCDRLSATQTAGRGECRRRSRRLEFRSRRISTRVRVGSIRGGPGGGVSCALDAALLGLMFGSDSDVPGSDRRRRSDSDRRRRDRRLRPDSDIVGDARGSMAGRAMEADTDCSDFGPSGFKLGSITGADVAGRGQTLRRPLPMPSDRLNRTSPAASTCTSATHTLDGCRVPSRCRCA